MTTPRLAISSSIWMKVPPLAWKLPGHFLAYFGCRRNRIPCEECAPRCQRAFHHGLVSLHENAPPVLGSPDSRSPLPLGIFHSASSSCLNFPETLGRQPPRSQGNGSRTNHTARRGLKCGTRGGPSLGRLQTPAGAKGDTNSTGLAPGFKDVDSVSPGRICRVDFLVLLNAPNVRCFQGPPLHTNRARTTRLWREPLMC